MKRILVAVDNSERAKQVIDAAARLAELGDAKLVVFRAITAEVPRDWMLPTDRRVEDVLRSNAHEDLSRAVAHVPPDLVEQIVVELATPADGICHAARERDADLVVIGAHGYGGIARLLGTTAAKVVNHADRNVLVVRTPL